MGSGRCRASVQLRSMSSNGSGPREGRAAAMYSTRRQCAAQYGAAAITGTREHGRPGPVASHYYYYYSRSAAAAAAESVRRRGLRGCRGPWECCAGRGAERTAVLRFQDGARGGERLVSFGCR